ncbi:hypothetical protein B0H67DRAFT_562713 [Lasiosphaeris hirsuta]|uniref:Uncharacterized protein n=1 Tax=Lasiosphaeris hirsuta TaxID=260670 RepID=A0AA40BAP4_9PEZI|nr:hypothetical protein B0H67DRAFT_562713 [Lasiosphaeris hirsuta]
MPNPNPRYIWRSATWMLARIGMSPRNDMECACFMNSESGGSDLGDRQERLTGAQPRAHWC